MSLSTYFILIIFLFFIFIFLQNIIKNIEPNDGAAIIINTTNEKKSEPTVNAYQPPTVPLYTLSPSVVTTSTETPSSSIFTK